MPKRQSIWQLVSQHRFVRSVAGLVVVLVALALMFLGSGFFTNISSASAASCMNSNTPYVVHSDDTPSNLAQSHQTSSASNKIASPNLIYVDQNLCVPAIVAPVQQPLVSGNRLPTNRHFSADGIKGTYNNFPYGQCTWWANVRYHQLTGIYVPWTTNSNANVWRDRAIQYHWKVSTQPKVGSIMMLTPGVEGAFSDGHVAIVEKLLGGGRFDVSQMNWNGGVGIVSHTTFTAEPGVYFITI